MQTHTGFPELCLGKGTGGGCTSLACPGGNTALPHSLPWANPVLLRVLHRQQSWAQSSGISVIMGCDWGKDSLISSLGLWNLRHGSWPLLRSRELFVCPGHRAILAGLLPVDFRWVQIIPSTAAPALCHLCTLKLRKLSQSPRSPISARGVLSVSSHPPLLCPDLGPHDFSCNRAFPTFSFLPSSGPG